MKESFTTYQTYMTYKGVEIKLKKEQAYRYGARREKKFTVWWYKVTWINSKTKARFYGGTAHDAVELRRDAIKNAKEYIDYLVTKKKFYGIKTD